MRAGDDAQRARHELGGTRALRAVALHVVHLAVIALAEPVEEARLGLAEVAAGDADLLEAQLRAPALDVARERIRLIDELIRCCMRTHQLDHIALSAWIAVIGLCFQS